jgi:hypothetical protein
MSHKNPGLVLEPLHEDLFKNLLLDICVQSRNGVVHEHNLPIGIYSSGKTHSSFLPSREVNPLLSNFCKVSSRKDFKIPSQLADLDGLDILGLIIRKTEKYIVSNGFILDPGVLLDEGYRFSEGNGSLRGRELLTRKV